MKIALFDLDHTLLDGDTNVLWIDYLVAHNLVAPDTAARQQRYMAAYAAEQLDMTDYLDFHLGLLSTRPISEWQPIVVQFVRRELKPRLAPAGLESLASHRAAGHQVALVTATHSVLVHALSEVLGVHALASEAEIIDGHTTGRITGLPSFREHKIARVEAWLGRALSSEAISESYFYSDSVNDLPLLQAVSHPVVVNGDQKLTEIAAQRGWRQERWAVRQAVVQA